jgi:hypothetical protein
MSDRPGLDGHDTQPALVLRLSPPLGNPEINDSLRPPGHSTVSATGRRS